MIGSGLVWQFIKWHKLSGNWLAERLFDQPLPPPTAREVQLAADLKEDLLNAPAANMLPKWVTFRDTIRQNFESYDPRTFLRWPLVQHTMCVTNSGQMVREWPALRSSRDWPRFEKAVRESDVGHPIRFLYHPQSSGNLLHHCYHVMRFEEVTGLHVSKLDLVVEFGGGYGSMCRLLHNLSFRGAYLIYDLPEFSALQRYFLKSLGLPVRDATDVHSTDGIFLFSELPKLEAALQRLGAKQPSAFIATWSLSESPVELREKFLPLVRDFDGFLLAFQDKFGPVDNCDFFRKLRESTAETIDWTPRALRHIPNNNYLFGRQRCAKL